MRAQGELRGAARRAGVLKQMTETIMRIAQLMGTPAGRARWAQAPLRPVRRCAATCSSAARKGGAFLTERAYLRHTAALHFCGRQAGRPRRVQPAAAAGAEGKQGARTSARLHHGEEGGEGQATVAREGVQEPHCTRHGQQRAELRPCRRREIGAGGGAGRSHRRMMK